MIWCWCIHIETNLSYNFLARICDYILLKWECLHKTFPNIRIATNCSVWIPLANVCDEKHVRWPLAVNDLRFLIPPVPEDLSFMTSACELKCAWRNNHSKSSVTGANHRSTFFPTIIGLRGVLCLMYNMYLNIIIYLIEMFIIHH